MDCKTAACIDVERLPQLETPARTDIQLYVQVYDVLYALICDGVARPGDLLPGENALAAHFGVSRGTVRQAVQYLEEDGLVVKRQGRTTEVVDRGLRQSGGMQNFSDVCREFCTVPLTDTTVRWTFSGAGSWLSEQLQMSKSALMVNFDVTYYSGKEPVALSQRLVPSVWLERCSVDATSQAEMQAFAVETVPGLVAQSRSEIMLKTEPIPELPRTEELPYFSISEIAMDGEDRPVGHLKNYLRGDCYRLYVGRRQGLR